VLYSPSSAPVAQLDRASASGAEGYRFEPYRAYQLNQQVTRGPFRWSARVVPLWYRAPTVVTAALAPRTWHSRGHRFDPGQLHQPFLQPSETALIQKAVSSLVRVLSSMERADTLLRTTQRRGSRGGNQASRCRSFRIPASSTRAQIGGAIVGGSRAARLCIGSSGEPRSLPSVRPRPRRPAHRQPPSPQLASCRGPRVLRDTHRFSSRARESSRRSVSWCMRARRSRPGCPSCAAHGRAISRTFAVRMPSSFSRAGHVMSSA